MDGELTPVGKDELEETISIHLAVMRARRESGWIHEPPFFAKALAARLLLSNLKIFRGPPAKLHSFSGGKPKDGS